MSNTPVREASLRSAYQPLYRGIQAGVWYIAASVPAGVRAEWNRQPAGPGSGRALSDLHFEFRGGEEFHLRPPDARTRREDRLASRSEDVPSE